MTALTRPHRTADPGGGPAPRRSVVGGIWFLLGLVLTAVCPAALFAGLLACAGDARALLRGTRRRQWLCLVR